MTIRPALPSDAAVIADLATQLGYPSRPEEAEARLRDVLSQPSSAVLVAEDEDGMVIGYGHVFGAHRVDADPFAEIGALVVDQNRRSRGTGAVLVSAMEKWAVGQGYRSLRVRSNVIRDRAHAFYERLGFGRIKVQQVFARSISTRR
jgi:GNAT superfamily N-acetyltransferase